MADARPITVVVADDQRLIRAGFTVILNSQPDIEVVGEAADGSEAVSLCRSLRPDVVLMDIRMPVMDGLAAAREIVSAGHGRVVVLTTFGNDEYVYEALRLGASGFLLKDCPPEQLLTAVRVAAAGDAMVDPSITRRLIASFVGAARSAGARPAIFDRLTAREAEVLRLMARGLSNAEIGRELVVEESTVKTHVARVLMKLELRDRVQAVVLAFESGFVVPDGR